MGKYTSTDLGGRVKKLRGNIPQWQLAEGASVSQGYLSVMERKSKEYPVSFCVVCGIVETLVKNGAPRKRAMRLYELAGLKLKPVLRTYTLDSFLGAAVQIPVIYYPSLGDAIKTIREYKGIRQAAIENVGITQGTLSCIENNKPGSKNPYVSTFVKIFQGLNATPPEIISVLKAAEPRLDEDSFSAYMDAIIGKLETKFAQVEEDILSGRYGEDYRQAYQMSVELGNLVSANPNVAEYYFDLSRRSRDFRRSTLEMFREA